MEIEKDNANDALENRPANEIMATIGNSVLIASGRTLNEAGRVNIFPRELQIVIAIQEVRWPKFGERKIRALNHVANSSIKYINLSHQRQGSGSGYDLVTE